MIEACAEFSDVISFNIYKKTIKQRTATNDGWASYNEVRNISQQFGKPVIISEFQFGSTDHGAFSATIVPESAAKNQADRATLYYNYVQDVAADKNFIGCHYYMYHDAPLTGEGWQTQGLRAETYGVGLISVTDDPYPLLIQKAKEINLNLYQYRIENTQP